LEGISKLENGIQRAREPFSNKILKLENGSKEEENWRGWKVWCWIWKGKE